MKLILLSITQEFVREKAENQSLYEGIHSEACHLEDKSDIATEVAHINEQWAAICQATEERGQLLRAVAESWTFYSDSSADVHDLINGLEVKVQQQPNVHAIDVLTLRAELNSCEVRRTVGNMHVFIVVFILFVPHILVVLQMLIRKINLYEVSG